MSTEINNEGNNEANFVMANETENLNDAEPIKQESHSNGQEQSSENEKKDFFIHSDHANEEQAAKDNGDQKQENSEHHNEENHDTQNILPKQQPNLPKQQPKSADEEPKKSEPEKQPNQIGSNPQKKPELEKRESDEKNNNTAQTVIDSQSKIEVPSDIKGPAISPFEEKIALAVEKKNNGNVLYKNGDYVNAIKEYSDGLRILDPNQFYQATPEECRKMAETSAILLCNIGYSYFNSNDMNRAEVFLSEAITVNPRYIKAIHKRALARYQLQKYEEAFTDIKLAFSLDKSNTEVHSSYSKILQKYNEQQKKNKESTKGLSQKMFRTNSQKSSGSVESPTKQKAVTPESSENTYTLVNFVDKSVLIGGVLATLFSIFKK